MSLGEGGDLEVLRLVLEASADKDKAQQNGTTPFAHRN